MNVDKLQRGAMQALIEAVKEVMEKKEEKMPKCTLTFNLPEEKDAFTLANKGGDFWSCLWELDQQCRNYVKHGHEFKSAEEVLAWIREFINENVDMDCVS